MRIHTLPIQRSMYSWAVIWTKMCPSSQIMRRRKGSKKCEVQHLISGRDNTRMVLVKGKNHVRYRVAHQKLVHLSDADLPVSETRATWRVRKKIEISGKRFSFYTIKMVRGFIIFLYQGNFSQSIINYEHSLKIIL